MQEVLSEAKENACLPHLVVSQRPRTLHQQLDLVAGGRRPAWLGEASEHGFWLTEMTAGGDIERLLAGVEPAHEHVSGTPQRLVQSKFAEVAAYPFGISRQFRHGPAKALEVRRQHSGRRCGIIHGERRLNRPIAVMPDARTAPERMARGPLRRLEAQPLPVSPGGGQCVRGQRIELAPGVRPGCCPRHKIKGN